MTLPASVVSTSKAFDLADAMANDLKAQAQNIITDSSAGPITLKRIGDYAAAMASSNTAFNTAIGLGSALNAYAQQVKRDGALDYVAGLQALQTAITNVQGWINTNFPRATAGSPLFFSGALQEYTFDANFNRVALTVTTAQTAGLRTQLATITAAVT